MAEIEEKIIQVIDEDIRPGLQMDGGDIEFLGMEGNKAKVRLLGMCAGCMHAQMTLSMGVEKRIKARVPECEGVVTG